MANAVRPPTTPPATAPVLGEPPELPLDVELLPGGPSPVAGVMPYVGEKVLAMSGVALATHWHGNTEKFLRS